MQATPSTTQTPSPPADLRSAAVVNRPPAVKAEAKSVLDSIPLTAIQPSTTNPRQGRGTPAKAAKKKGGRK